MEAGRVGFENTIFDVRLARLTAAPERTGERSEASSHAQHRMVDAAPAISECRVEETVMEQAKVDHDDTARTARAAWVISSFTLLSRVLGFVRDMAMFATLGASWVMGTFVLAWMLPNMLRRLFGEGALSAAFIRRFAATLDGHGRQPARALLGAVSGALISGLLPLALVVVGACLLVPAEWIAPRDPAGGEAARLLVRLTAILFPYVLFICLTAIFSGALNSLGSFALPASLPIVLNVFWLGGIGLAVTRRPDDAAAQATIVAWALLAGGIVQLGLSAWALARRGMSAWPQLPAAGSPARAVFRDLAPMLLGMSMVQINGLVDQGLAYWLLGAGQNSHVYLANRLLLFPHALTSLALATAVFPRMAVLASREDRERLRASLDGSLRLTLLLAVPAAAGLVVVARDFVEVFFLHGAFTERDAAAATATTRTLVLGLPFLGVAQLHARVHYALGKPGVPARVAAWMVPLNVVLNLVLALGLNMGVTGLTTATSLCAAVQAWLLGASLRAVCPGATRWARAVVQIALATTTMVAVVAALGAVFEPSTTLGRAMLDLALPIGAGIAVYVTTMAWWNRDDLHALMRRRHSMRTNS